MKAIICRKYSQFKKKSKPVNQNTGDQMVNEFFLRWIIQDKK
jgi:hypothetical protein